MIISALFVMSNLFSHIPDNLPEELIEEIVHHEAFKLERIVSKGHATPPGTWLDQKRDEWVVLLKGSAGLTIGGKKITMTLRPGDHVLIPAHTKHRVEWTEEDTETVWLALHYEPTATPGVAVGCPPLKKRRKD